jgi:4-hydroxy-tetrahydrodipicolinate synthase
MTTKNFAGVYTALITPFKAGKIDLAALERIVHDQLSAGIHGLVVNGTTAESPTLHDDERNEIIKLVVKLSAGKVPVIVGTGTNATEKTVTLSREATELGADGLLVVNPYYNKPTQEGLYQHFSAVAKSTDLPIMLYNIKGRSAVNLETETLARLMDVSNIVAVKEASGDLSQMMAVLEHVRKNRPDFSVMSGDDGLTFPLMALGGKGVVSVASNIVPAALVEMVEAAARGDFTHSREMHFRMQSLFQILFCESNPSPVKYAASLLFDCEDSVRLPIVSLSEKFRPAVKQALMELRSGV